MTNVERKIVARIERHRIALFIIIISAIALLARYVCLDMVSRDYRFYLSDWFEQIDEGGGLKALDTQVGNYNVIYQAIIALLTYLPFDPLHMYKAVSIVFDYVLAVGIGLLAMEFRGGRRIYFALGYALALFLPTCIFNSAMWGQCDSMYASMLAFWFLFTLRRRHVAAFVFLGLAFCLKFQTIFVLPFLIYHYIVRKEFSLLHGLIPLAFAIIPSVLCGRHPLETFRVYLGQASHSGSLYMLFPNFWSIITGEREYLGHVALFTTIAFLGIGLLCVMQRKHLLETREDQLYMLIWTMWTCLMFLPSMHERYGYFVEMLMVVAFLYNFKLFPIALLMETSAVVTYASYLWEESASISPPMQYAVLLYHPAYIAFTCYMLYRGFKGSAPNGRMLKA